MSDSVQLQGACLCKKVHVELPETNAHIGACHCEMCLTWCGGPGFAIDVDDRVTFRGEEYIKVYKSSDWGERAFCSECGTNVYYRLVEPNKYFVYAGIFGVDSNLVLDHQIYIDEKPAYYNFVEQTPTFTGEQVAAMFTES